VAAATYLAARIVGTWELYLAALTFLATLLAAWLLVLATSRRLSILRSLHPRQPTAGDDLVVSLRATNGSQLPGLEVTVPDVTGDLQVGGTTIAFPSLGPYQERVIASPALPARRGVHVLPAPRVEAEDALGLWRARRRLGETLEVTVYPRLVELGSCAVFADLGARRGLARRGLARRGASELRGIRPHQPGEPLNHVDWKATAKTATLMLREMDDPESGDVTVLLDGSSAGVTGEEPLTSFELAVQAAASVADFVLAAGHAAVLLVHDGGWRPTRLTADVQGRRRLLDTLAAARPNARTPLATSLQHLRTNGGRLTATRTLVAVTLTLDRDLARALIGLQRDGVQTRVIAVDGDSFGTGGGPAPVAAAASRAAPGPRAAGAWLDRGALVALAAAGVVCLTLRADDDLRTALSLGRGERDVGDSALRARGR
jgi:uncharacterized protein (DUF58 family)